ncbi:MAG: metallophosphoesterase family protein [Verrucomicrobia bacterium]|nr:metallophosphoesterase family protein [Verrucomicrobiota bacterium]
MRRTNLIGVLAAVTFAVTSALAHTGTQPSVHDTVAGVLERLRQAPTRSRIEKLDPARAERLLTRAERQVLATGHITFHVNQPARVTVFRDKSLDSDPFWLREGGWRKTPETVKVGDTTFDLWEKDFAAGEVGLGVNSIRGGGRHYFVAVAPLGGQPLALEDLYPGQLRLTNLVAGVPPWADRTETLKVFPERFTGRTLIQTLHARRDDAKLVDRLRWTKYPAGPRPDHVVLTWADDPRTSQAIQWRTSRKVERGAVAVCEAAAAHRPVATWLQVPALTTVLTSPSTVNNPTVNRHTVELTGLKPGTRYVYRVGTGDGRQWSEPREFTTAPAGPASFSFVYLGDAQNGLDTWGRLLRGAFQARPDAAFHLLAGDLVNRGNERDDWDEFFENAQGVFDRRPLVPVIGNHECQGGLPTMYLNQFALPRNGPPSLTPERAYSFEYGHALFVILDSNLSPASQAPWLEETLARSGARWKFVAYHHPAYSSAPNRDNQAVRDVWVPIFDRHGVDLALQGHDHAYLRTHPLRAGQPVADPANGTTYIVSVSGTKMYDQVKRPETLVGFTKVSTWQVLDLELEGDRLTYRAYDAAGRLRDQFVIQK